MKRVLIVILALVVTGFAEQTSFKLHNSDLIPPKVKVDLTLVGSVASAYPEYRNGKQVTVVRIMEFSRNRSFGEPTISTVLLCGEFGNLTHTNIMLTYNPASPSRTTGCLNVLSASPWEDGKVKTITWDSTRVKKSGDLEKTIRGIINDSRSK